MVNGWFPRINERGEVVSGNTEIWITRADGSQKRLVEKGGGPVWLTADSFLYNDGVSRQVRWPNGDSTPGYNTIATDQAGNWAGYTAQGAGYVHRYEGMTPTGIVQGAAAPQFGGGAFGYLLDPQSTTRTLVVNGEARGKGPILDFLLGPPLIQLVATGTYTRAYVGAETVQAQEGAPVFSDGWICSNAGGYIDGLYLRPLDSVYGYFLPGGDWFFHDFRKFGPVLMVAASTSRGELRIVRLNVNDPRRDLRAVKDAPPVDPPVPPIHYDPPPVPPVPPNEPPPKGPTVDIPNQLATVQRVRASYPTPLGARHAAFLAELALATGMGLLRKPGGTVITMPDGVTVSQDILMDRASSRIFDVLGDGEGAAVPSWGEAAGSPADPARFYAVTGAPPVDPPKPPPPPVPPVDLSAILARLEAAEKKIDALQRAEVDVLDQVHQLDATTVKVGQLPDLSQVARKGDRVEVSGRINFGLNRWGGIISK